MSTRPAQFKRHKPAVNNHKAPKPVPATRQVWVEGCLFTVKVTDETQEQLVARLRARYFKPVIHLDEDQPRMYVGKSTNYPRHETRQQL